MALCDSCHEAVQSDFVGTDPYVNETLVQFAAQELGEEISDHLCDDYEEISAHVKSGSLSACHISQICVCGCRNKEWRQIRELLKSEKIRVTGRAAVAAPELKKRGVN